MQHLTITDKQQEESHWWQLFCNGNKTALSFFYKKYYNLLYNYGLKWIPDKELVEDCIQDVFIKILQNYARLLPTPNVKGYLLKALRNKILDCFEKERITEPIEGYEEAFAEEMAIGEVEDGDEQTELLLRSFSELSPRQREILYLYYVNELTHEDIARLLGINYQSSKNLLFRSLSKLKKIFIQNTHFPSKK